MVELIGDSCIPSELIIPDRTTTSANGPTTTSGALLYMSGATLYWADGDNIISISGSTVA